MSMKRIISENLKYNDMAYEHSKNIRSVFLSKDHKANIERFIKEVTKHYPKLHQIKVLEISDQRNVFNDRDFIKVVFNMTLLTSKFIEVATKCKWHIFLADRVDAIVPSTVYIQGAEEITDKIKSTIQKNQNDINRLVLDQTMRTEQIRRSELALESVDEIIKQQVMNNQLSIDNLMFENRRQKDRIEYLENKLAASDAAVVKLSLENKQNAAQLEVSREVIESNQDYIGLLQLNVKKMSVSIKQMTEEYSKTVEQETKNNKKKIVSRNLGKYNINIGGKSISLKKITRFHEEILRLWHSKNILKTKILNSFEELASIGYEEYHERYSFLCNFKADCYLESNCVSLQTLCNKSKGSIEELVRLHGILTEVKKNIKEVVNRLLESI